MSDQLTTELGIARARGFLGPGDVAFHVEHGRRFLAGIPTGSRVLDLGSGGGVPGLVIAFERPDVTVVLLDASERRTRFLEEVLDRHQWGHVRVLRARAETAGRVTGLRATFDVVVSRSFAPPAVAAECAAPFLKVGGRMIVSEPEGTPSPDRWDAAGLDSLGLELAERIVDPPATLQVLRQVRICPDRYPRRVGVPEKRPLF